MLTEATSSSVQDELISALQDELIRLRQKNRLLQDENARLQAENERLQVALRQEPANANLGSYGTHEMTAGTCVGARRRRR